MAKDKNQKINREVWLCDLTHTQQTIASDSMPLGIGLIAAYGQSKFKKNIKFRLFKYPEILIKNLLAGQPEIIGFSNYTWNLDLSYQIAKKIKKISPKTAVVFGGPNYPLDVEDQEEFLKKRKAVDFYIYGEGEEAFSDLLSILIDNNFDIDKAKSLKPSSCHFLDRGEFIKGENTARIKIDEIPSPYLTGIMDEFFDGKLMPLIQTCRGCPFTCAYCCEGQPYFKFISFNSIKKISAEIEYIAKRSKENKRMFIADSNFALYPRDLEVCRVIAKAQKKYGYPDYIHVAAAKNNKEMVLEAARITNGSFRLSGSVQSTDPTVLKNINRQNVSLDTIIELAKEAGKIGSNTYAEIILALPGDNLRAYFKSVKDMMDTGLTYLRVWTLMMLNGSQLTSRAFREKFGLKTKYRVMPRGFGAYDFGKEKIYSVETEEVCIANKTMSFKDYLESRLFVLTVEIFYNDAILSELLQFLARFSISAFDFVKRFRDSRQLLTEWLKNLYNEFLRETKDELWDSPKKLENFAKKPNNLAKYLSGEYGSNLVFKYKTLAFAKHIPAIHDAAFAAAEKLLSARDVKGHADFLGEMKRYSLFQKTDIFDTKKVYRDKFYFDWEGMKRENFAENNEKFRLASPVKVEFRHTKEQAKAMDNYLDEFGSDVIGMSRIFSRIHLKKMYREMAVKKAVKT